MKELQNLHHVDVSALTRQGAVREGRTRIGVFDRLMTDLLPNSSEYEVVWRMKFEQKALPGAAKPQDWLHLNVLANVAVTCQSCLEPLDVSFEIDREFRFVENEELAQEQDEESEEDVLTGIEDFNLAAWLEDELILALPLAPRHGGCIAQYKPVDDDLAEGKSSLANPFAVLQQIKTRH